MNSGSPGGAQSLRAKLRSLELEQRECSGEAWYDSLTKMLRHFNRRPTTASSAT
jgi:hypothetical protein